MKLFNKSLSIFKKKRLLKLRNGLETAAKSTNNYNIKKVKDEQKRQKTLQKIKNSKSKIKLTNDIKSTLN